MTPQQYECALLARVSFQLSLSNSVEEMLAVACTLRNWVIPKLGQVATYKSYPEACADFLRTYPTRDEPNLTEDAFIAPSGLLAQIEKIYDCTFFDITATQTTPGARDFARAAAVTESDWRWQIIHSRPVLGTFGSQQFFA